MIDFTRYSAVTFDCYGTLIDWEAGLSTTLIRWAKRHHLDRSSNELLEAFAQAELQLEHDYPTLPYPEILRAVLRALAERYRVEADKDIQSELADSVGQWEPFPDTVTALEKLKRFYKLVILSNVDRKSFSQSQKQLKVDFDFVVTAEDIGSYKPDLQNFKAALHRLANAGIAQDRIMHVAQSLHHDHAPAQHLGLTSVWIDRRHGMTGAGAVAKPQETVHVDAVYQSMAEFSKAVEQAWTSARTN